MSNQNYRKAMAIEAKNKKRILEINPHVDDGSGIYFLTRTDDDGIRYAYIGQAKHLLTRLAQHLSGYQHIDLSIKNHGLYTADNITGWKVGFLHYPEDKLDEMEQFQSSLPRGERLLSDNIGSSVPDFNPRSREGSDEYAEWMRFNMPLFQSSLPRGERRCTSSGISVAMYFNPRSHEGSD